MRAESTEALEQAQKEHRMEMERLRAEVKSQNETLQKKSEMVRSLTSKNIASRFRMAHLKQEAKEAGAAAEAAAATAITATKAAGGGGDGGYGQEEEKGGEEQGQGQGEQEPEQDEEAQREEHKQELAALQKRLEKVRP